MTVVLQLFLGACLLHASIGYYKLRELSYTRLPTSISRGANVYGGLNLGTATQAAYDFSHNILYIIGETSHLIHVLDISDPTNPSTVFTYQFTIGEGVPTSLAVCGLELAVVLRSAHDTSEGHIRFYKTHQRGSGYTNLDENGYVTVGPHPAHIQYTADCSSIVVSNEGEPGKDEGGNFINPDGSVTIIHGEKTGNPSVRMVDFAEYNMGAIHYDSHIRTPSLYIPTTTLSTMTTVAQDIEPENVAISADGKTAFVTLQENNAIAAIDISNGVVKKIKALPKKSWDTVGIDTSDRDGGVHRRMYPGLKSLRQPGVIKTLQVGSRNYLFTADEGAITAYNSGAHKFAWTDASLGRTESAKIDAAKTELKANALNDEMLGRLQISSVDGKNAFNGQYEDLEMFGGRGFSVWDTNDMAAPVFDSEGTFEEYMEAFDKTVFNCDYLKSTATYQSPEIMRDQASDNMGARVTGLDVADDNGTIFLVAGTWSTGTLFLYHVDVATNAPIPQFQSLYRSGTKDLPWNDLYKNETAGDLYISDLGIITSNHSPTDSPLLWVIGTGSGALSLYSIDEEHPSIPGGSG